MYAEEHLEDAFIDTADLSIYDEEDGSISLDSYVKEHRKRVEIGKLLDSDFYKFYKNIDGNRVKIEVYCTPVLNNARIRDAISGARTEYRAGSKYEDLFFVIKDSTGSGNKEKNNEPRRLYYENPGQCERHLGISISTQMKDVWNTKYQKRIAHLSR